jgi:hypothetical protein
MANIDPIYTKQGNLGNNAGTGMNALITAAAADYTGAGANNSLVFTAAGTVGGSTGGSFVQRLRLKAGGTNVAAVMRVYLNNGSANTSATNNQFYGEIALPATTAITNAVTAEIDYMMNIVLPPGWRIYCGLGAAVAAGWVVTAVAGDY